MPRPGFCQSLNIGKLWPGLRWPRSHTITIRPSRSPLICGTTQMAPCSAALAWAITRCPPQVRPPSAERATMSQLVFDVC